MQSSNEPKISNETKERKMLPTMRNTQIPLTEPERFEIACTWFDWVRSTGCKAKYPLHNDNRDDGRYLVGYLIQASAENPEHFARAFEPILGSDLTNPLTLIGEGALINLEGNGIGDDWEIYLQWREEGYVVVGEDLRQPQDARFRAKEAIRLLDIITGGQACAPGSANEFALVQAMYEQDCFIEKPKCQNERSHGMRS